MVNGDSSIEVIESLALVKLPKLGNTVFATRSAKRSVGGDGNGVDVSSVTLEIVLELAVGQGPDLDLLVPATGDAHADAEGRVGAGRSATDGGNPLRVSLVLNGPLVLTEGVPDANGLIARTGDDLTVISGESDGEDILGVSNETTGGGTEVKIPKTEGRIPRARQGEVTIRGDGDILDEVRMSMEALVRDTVVLVRLLGQVPDDEGLIARTGQDPVLVLDVSGGSSD